MMERTSALLRPASSSTGADDLDRTILEAADVVLARLGRDRFSLAEIAKVSLVPLARIYQRFADRNEVLGALSTRALSRLSFPIEPLNAATRGDNWPRQLDRLLDSLFYATQDPADAYLVLCGPFDPASNESKNEALDRLARSLLRALEQDDSTRGHSFPVDRLGYAAEIVFACLRRGLLSEGRVTSTAMEMASRAATSFVHDRTL